MRKNLGVKPYICPMPVLIISTYDENGVANAMNAAWGTICDTDRICIFLSKTHKTVENIMKNKAFCVSFANVCNVTQADYVGIASGHKTADKIEKAGWHVTRSEFVNAPLIDELPMALECKYVSYDEESECMIGEIINVSVEDTIMQVDNSIDMTKFRPIAYDPVNHDYLELGGKVGKAFYEGKKLM